MKGIYLYYFVDSKNELFEVRTNKPDFNTQLNEKGEVFDDYGNRYKKSNLPYFVKRVTLCEVNINVVVNEVKGE